MQADEACCDGGDAERMILLRSARFCILAGVPLAHAQDAASLRARHTALREQLSGSPFQRPLHLESSQSDGELRSDIYALVE